MVYSIQVKRSRNEDPSNALILQNSKRKRLDYEAESEAADPVPTDFVFKLARTYDTEQPGNRILLHGVRDETEKTEDIKKFRITSTKRQRKDLSQKTEAEDDASLVSPELREMIADYIKPQQQDQLTLGSDTVDKETEDYVYDVYFSEPAGPVTVDSVGYIELNEQEERLLFDNSESDSEDPISGGDEDSNAEDHYRNDYPDEEESDDHYDSDSDLEAKLTGLQMNDEEWSADEGDPGDISYERYGWR